ncbi:putative acyl-activating enzyme 16, chloroplastic isoform X2 [Wolffia australiana]
MANSVHSAVVSLNSVGERAWGRIRSGCLIGRLRRVPRRCMNGRCPSDERNRRIICQAEKNKQLESHRRRYSPSLESAQLREKDLVADDWKAVPDIWRSVAEKYQDQVALVDPYHEPPSKMTYKELEQAILNFSEGLRTIGLNPEEKIALYADNSCRWLVADQGIMATGAINVVRGSKSSDEELLNIYSHSESVAVVVDNLEFFGRLENILFKKAEIRFIILLWGEKSMLDHQRFPEISIYTYEEIEDLGKNSRDYRRHSTEGGHQDYDIISPGDLATLVYTSGTSSTPKGVMLTHSNILHQIKNLQEIVPAKPGDRFVSILPPWHMYERACEYFIFTRGIQLVYTTVKNLKEDLRKYQPEYLVAVPLVFEILYSAIQKQIFSGSAAKKFLVRSLIKISYLYMDAKRVYQGRFLSEEKEESHELSVIWWVQARVIAILLWPLHMLAKILIYRKIFAAIGIYKAGISGGGSLPMHIDRFFEAIGLTLQNGYGLSETSPVISARRPDCNVLGTVGHPIKFTAVKIVDPVTDDALPNGSKGIIKVRGPQVMKGYYKDSTNTNRVLDKDGWLNTGDIGWIVPTNLTGKSHQCGGMLVIEGRAKDTIVLSSGENIEPSEIEEAAARSSFIKQIMVIGQDERRLGALIVLDKDELALASMRLSADTLSASSELRAEESYRLVRRELSKWTLGLQFHIGPILILDEAFTIENGLMTPTMKVRRDKVMDRYKDQIAKMYNKDV